MIGAQGVDGKKQYVDAGMSGGWHCRSAREKDGSYQDCGDSGFHESLTANRDARSWISRSFSRTSAETPRNGLLGGPP
jgi:hypothetical protein